MRDKLMAQILVDYNAELAANVLPEKPSYKKKKGPHCPRCSSFLRKRTPVDAKHFFECVRHGFVREVMN